MKVPGSTLEVLVAGRYWPGTWPSAARPALTLLQSELHSGLMSVPCRSARHGRPSLGEVSGLSEMLPA